MYLLCPYMAEALPSSLMDCLLDLNIDCKLSSLIVDNCSTNDVVISILLDNFF